MSNINIKDNYIIGDLHSAALVSKNASIDWLCLPHFDSPSIFAKLLDKKAGSFSIDTSGYSVTSKYIKDTAIVEHTFQSNNAHFLVKDFMVPVPKSVCENHFLVRKFTSLKGKTSVTVLFDPQPEYASQKPDMNFDENNLYLQASVKKDVLLLYPPKNALVAQKDKGFEIKFNLSEGEEATVVLEYVMAGSSPLYKGQDKEKQTMDFWRMWVAKGKFFEFCRDQMVRSAITLKLMQFYPTGALVAAPTTSLPEEIGGVRNWDYRYVWIRDATFTLYAFYVLGYIEEAKKFFDFIHGILKQCAKDEFDVSLFYTIEGKPVPNEQVLNYLRGYKNSNPVRIGNGAKEQFQLDVYGALIDAYYFISKKHMEKEELHKELIMNLVYKIRDLWQTKDNGIWEVRSGQQHFTYSKVMAWVGADRELSVWQTY
ncbi:glycoside hydrolase family 15 protein [Candidatus Microgenomates bacterium]|nr:glycoside hydrolase family 15 protein [Candidatus Microgenomates bacterium]